MDIKPVVDMIKKDCLMCSTYRTFRPNDSAELKEKVLSALNQLTAHFEERFNDLRRVDAPLAHIQQAKQNKLVCLDATSLCRKCDKEVDQVGRQVIQIKA